MFEVTKRFGFSAAHHLPGLPEGHKCRNPHGHNYTVTVAVQSERLDEQGMVVDYDALSRWWDSIDARFDHRDLNDGINTPTAEWIANLLMWDLHDWLALGDRPNDPQVAWVEVSETPSTTARVTR